MHLLEVVHWKDCTEPQRWRRRGIAPLSVDVGFTKEYGGNYGPSVSPRGGPLATQSHVCAALWGTDFLLEADKALTKTKDKIPIDTRGSRFQLL